MGNCIFLRRGTPPSSAPQLGDLEPGSLIGIEENGTQVPFIVLAHGYPAADRTLVLRQDCCDEDQMWSNGGNRYSDSQINDWLNGDYLASLSSEIAAQIAPVSIEYTLGRGSSNTATLSCSVFLLSGTEVGCSGLRLNEEGEFISYFNANARRLAMQLGSAVEWWLRSPYYYDTTTVYLVPDDGDSGAATDTASRTHAVRPAFTLPINAKLPIIEAIMLPTGYSKLSYIESAGSQAINTGITPDLNTDVIMSFAMDSAPSSNVAIFGGEGQFAVRWAGNLATPVFRHNLGGKVGDFPSSIAAVGSHEVDKNGASCTLDGEVNVISGVSSITSDSPITFCAHNVDGTLSAFSSIKIYSSQIYQSGQLVRNFIPCQNPDGVVGLYDTVGGVFYSSATDDEFLAGV